METRSMTKRQKLGEKELTVKITETPIHNLPNECLLHIFTFLNVKDRLRSTAVCSRWRNLGSDAWRDVKELDLIDLRRLRTEHSRLISLCGRFLEDLSILVPMNPLIINVAAANCDKLKNLNVCFDIFGPFQRDYCKHLGKLINKNKTTLKMVSVENAHRNVGKYLQRLFPLAMSMIRTDAYTFFLI